MGLFYNDMLAAAEEGDPTCKVCYLYMLLSVFKFLGLMWKHFFFMCGNMRQKVGSFLTRKEERKIY